MTITKTYFMIDVLEDNNRHEVYIMEDELLTFLKEGEGAKWTIEIHGSFTKDFKDDLDENELEELKERLDNINSYIVDLKTALSDVDYYADEIEGESNY